MSIFKRLFNYLSPSKRKQAQNIDRRLDEIKEVRELSAGKTHRSPLGEQVKRHAEQAKLNRRLGKIQAEAEENARVRKTNDRLKNVRKEREALERQRSNPALRFMEGERVTDFSSSCVSAFWYEREHSLLFVQFKDNSLYRYGIAGSNNITGDMAMSLFRAASKGTWVWDNLRIRGTKLGHRVPYYLVSGGDIGRKYERTHESFEQHLEKVATQSTERAATGKGSNEKESAYEKLFEFRPNGARRRPTQHLGKLQKPGETGPTVKQGGKVYNVNRDVSGR